MGSRFEDSGVKGNEFFLLVVNFRRSALKSGPMNGGGSEAWGMRLS